MSDDSDDDFIKYGTPLEDLEDDEIPQKKPRLLEDQIVTDNQGRRRFHGAFTGGFSAGFFNTVGTLEGWTPSSYKSSKSEKQILSSTKPEDFMDEEDFSDFGIAPIVLKAKQDYSSYKSSAKSQNSHLGKFVLKDLLRPARETLGMKLLKKMGWKPGQGVGPRVTSNEKRNILKMRQKFYGCNWFDDNFDDAGDSELNANLNKKNFKFAPFDYEPLICHSGENIHGIGYIGLEKRSILSFDNAPLNQFPQSSKKRILSSQAFGVGVLEEEDEDIFFKEDMSHYDLVLDDDISNESISRKCENIKDVLEGFLPEVKKEVNKHYLLPLLPKNFMPHRQIFNVNVDVMRIPSRKKPTRWSSNEENLNQCTKNDQIKLNKTLTQKTTLKSCREIYKCDKSFENAVESHNQGLLTAEKLIADVKIIDGKFKPFSKNIEKQERYEKFLKLKEIGKKELLKNLQPIIMSEWEKEKEKIEFEKAAALFRPLNSMGDRFLTASQPDDVSDPLAVVEKFLGENDDRAKAAAVKMFGTLTRKIEEWSPSQSLCKRFNLPESKKKRDEQSPGKITKPVLLLSLPCDQNYETDGGKTENISQTVEESIQNFDDVAKKKCESTEGKIGPAEKKTDLFRAIFLASDCEEEESSFEENTIEKKQKQELSFEEKLLNNEKSDCLPSGIFENIDLESLKARQKQKIVSPAAGDESKSERIFENVVEDSVYGPKLPDKILSNSNCFKLNDEVDSEAWVEKKNRKHKKKKEKKSLCKTRHKHKRKKKR